MSELQKSVYKYYTRVDVSGLIWNPYSTAFQSPREGDICIDENAPDAHLRLPGGEYQEWATQSGIPLYRWDGSKAVRRTPEEIEADEAAIKSALLLPMKLAEISTACQTAIRAGIELDGERFSLTTEDQINIQNLALQIQGGAESVLYHADGGLCEPFPAAKMLALAEAAVRHVTYHMTYCNHLNAWIRRANEEELSGIWYGVELPPDLAEHMQALLEGASP